MFEKNVLRTFFSHYLVSHTLYTRRFSACGNDSGPSGDRQEEVNARIFTEQRAHRKTLTALFLVRRLCGLRIALEIPLRRSVRTYWQAARNFDQQGMKCR